MFVKQHVQVPDQRGMTLVEALLGVAIASLMLILLSQWLRTASDEMRSKRTADSLQQFAQVASHYLDANREGMLKAMAGDATEAAKYCKLGASPIDGSGGGTAYKFDNTTDPNNWKAVCAVDAAWLIWKKQLPGGFPQTNAYGQKWVAIYRLVYAKYDGTNMTTQGDVEMLIAATGGSAMPNSESALASELIGGNGGFLPDSSQPVAGCASGYICGAGGMRVKVSDFEFSY